MAKDDKNVNLTFKVTADTTNLDDIASKVKQVMEQAVKKTQLVKIDADTSEAEGKIAGISKRIDLANRYDKATINIKADGTEAEKTINELQDKIKGLTVKLDTSKLKSQLNEKLQELNNDESLKKVKLGVNTKSLLTEVNKAITSINNDESLKKLKLGVDSKYLQTQLNKAVKELDATVKLKTKLDTSSRRSDTKGTVTTTKTSKEESDAYQSLFSKRASAIQNMDKAYQEFGRDSKELRGAFKEFLSASREMRKFGRDTGVLSLNKINSDLERLIDANLSNNFVKNALLKERDKILRDRDALDRTLNPDKYARLEAKERVNQLKAEHGDSAATRSQMRQEAKAIFDSLSASLKDFSATVKQITGEVKKSYADQVNSKYNPNAIKNNMFSKSTYDQVFNDPSLMNKDMATGYVRYKMANLAAQNREQKWEQQWKKDMAREDLLAMSHSSKASGIFSEEQFSNFKSRLEEYRSLIDNFNTNFYKKIGKELGITDESHPFYKELQKMYQKEKATDKKWDEQPVELANKEADAQAKVTGELKSQSALLKDKILAQKQLLADLAKSAKEDKVFDKDKAGKFFEELQAYRDLTQNYSSSFLLRTGKQLGITNEHPYFAGMKTAFESARKQEQEWYKKPITAEVDVKGGEKLEEVKQKTLTVTQQFMRLRGEALKAGNALNQATDPKEVARLTEEFKKAIQSLVNYQRATRGLTKGGEAQLVEKLAIGNIKEQTEAWKVLYEWVKKTVQAQRDYDIGVGRKLPRRSKDTDFMSYLNNMDWGHAVSGMAYAARGELNTVQALGNFISSMSQLSGVVGTFAKFLGGIGVALLTFTGIINAASSAFNSLVNMLSQVGRAIYDALRPGIELYKLRETAQLSMAATLSNMAKEGGEPISYERGLEMSKDMINRMFMDAVRSAFNPEELIRAMQGTLGIALSKGFSLEQAYNVVKSTAAVGKAIQLPQNQLLQEVRDILQGTLTARSSQVAYAVGMTPDQLKEAQSVSAKVGMTEEGIKAAEEQGKLYEYIMSKMQTYNVALEKYADTFSGAMDRLTESWAVAGMQIFEQIAPGLNGVIDNFIKTFIGDIDANDNFQSVKTLQEVGKALDEIIFKLLADVDALLDLIKEVTGEEDNIGAIKVLIKDAIDLVALGLGALIVIVDGFKDAAILSYNTFVVLKNAVKVATGYIYGFIDALRALTVLDFEGMKNRLDALNKQYEGYRNKSWEEIVSEGMINPKDIEGGLGLGHYGKFYQSYGEGHAKYDKGQPKPYDPNNVVGDMVNAGKQNLADLRKAMQEAIEKIKQELKEALAKLKDIAEQNELAYRQGYKSIEDYFSQKAQLEYQEAQLKVAALQREIEEVQKLDTGGDAGAQYQKERDLVRLNGELVIQQRESVKKEEQQTELLQHIYNHLANQTYKQGITAGTQIGSGRSVASLSQIPDDVYYDVADADIEGLTDLTLQKLNAVAYEYFKEFGERIVVTSAKRYGDGSSWHDSGQAFDIAMDSLYDKSRRVWLEEIAEKYALVPLDEYPGEPGAIYAHGDNFHFSDRGDPLEEVMETVEQESEKAQNMLHGRMPQAVSTLAEAFEKAVEEGQNQMIAAQKQYASYMNKPYLYETISSAEVSVKYRKQIDTARARFGEMMPAIANYLELAFPVEQLKVESKALEQFVDNRLKMIEDDSLAMNKRLREKTMLFPQAIDTYLSYFSEKINDWAITDLLDKMAQKADELAKLGAVSEARDITKKIIEVRSKFISMIQSWIDEMNNYFNYRRELINADSGLTSFVKEERIKQLDKGEARVKAVAYAQEAVKLDELQTKYQEQLTKVIEGRNDELDKTMQTDTKLLEMSIAQLETEKQRALRQAEINAKLGEQKTLWQETMDAANQALENGLYNFMTDYINTAESIGEAFRNMAIDILKDLQKFFAKKAITDLMHVITGTPNVEYQAPSIADTQTASNTSMMLNQMITANTYLAQIAGQNMVGSSPMLGTSSYGNYNYATSALPPVNSGLGMFGYQDYNTYKALTVSAPGVESSVATSTTQTVAATTGFQNQMVSMLPSLFGSLGGTLVGIINALGSIAGSLGLLYLTYVAIKYILDAVVEIGHAILDAVVEIGKEFVKLFAYVAGLILDWNTSAVGLARAIFGNSDDDAVEQTDAVTLLSSILSTLSAIYGVNSAIASKLGVDTKDKTKESSEGSEGDSTITTTTDTDISDSDTLLEENKMLVDSIYQRRVLDKLESIVSALNTMLRLNIVGLIMQLISIITMASATKSFGSFKSTFKNNFGFATGGYISGKGTSTSDSIPAMLSNGEYVIKADAVRRYGLNFLDAVNNGHFTRMRTVIPRFADGGYVGDALQDTARGMTDFAKNIGTSVGVDNTISIALVRDEQEAIREWAKSPSGGQKFLVDFAKGNGRVFSRFNR